MITPEEYLKSIGIDLKQTAVFTIIEGYARQPDLCKLLETYAELKLKEKS